MGLGYGRLQLQLLPTNRAETLRAASHVFAALWFIFAAGLPMLPQVYAGLLGEKQFLPVMAGLVMLRFMLPYGIAAAVVCGLAMAAVGQFAFRKGDTHPAKVSVWSFAIVLIFWLLSLPHCARAREATRLSVPPGPDHTVRIALNTPVDDVVLGHGPGIRQHTK